MKDWGGVIPEREKLVGMWVELTEGVVGDVPGGRDVKGRMGNVKQGRLVTLMRQAVAWQVGNTKRRGEKPWTVKS
jgi:COMPASS component SWD3